MGRVFVYTEWGGPEVQRFVDLPTPTPGPGELLVRMQAAGVNPADWKLRANYHNLPNPPQWPAPMGRECAGIVEGVGEGVDDFAVGDRVFGIAKRNGGWSEFPILTADEAAHIPEGVSFRDASTLAVASATAFDGITQLHPGAGEVILISGAGGGVGLAALQMARNLGADVIGTASDGKQALVERFGGRWTNYGDGEADRVCAIYPDGVDAFLDNLGGATLRSLAPVVKGDRFVSTAENAGPADLGGQLLKRNRNSATLVAVGAMVADGSLDPYVTEVFPFSNVADAMALVEDGHVAGKVVVEID